jgi:hypothetical protein
MIIPVRRLSTLDDPLPPAVNFVRAVENVQPTFADALLAVAVFGAGVYLLGKMFEQRQPKARRRSYNSEPLSWPDKEYVSYRDAWRCTYCGKRVTRATRHIDHSVSRANGGTNHLNNLRLSCAACNLSKGALNSRQFAAWRS